jgi:hypothetical protein
MHKCVNIYILVLNIKKKIDAQITILLYIVHSTEQYLVIFY